MKGLKIFFVFGVVALFGILLGCEEAIVNHKPQDTRIVFYSNRTDSTEVFVMDEDGLNQQRITPSGLDILPVGRAPLWRPLRPGEPLHRRRIAFTCFLGGGGPPGAIILINSDGTELDTLCVYPTYPILRDLSPSGNHILYQAADDGQVPKAVFIINSNGTGAVKLDDGYDCRFCGNNKVVYTNEGDIFIINTDGTGKKQLTDSLIGGFPLQVSYYMPIGSPNGEKIAFGVNIPLDPNYALGIMNSDGSRETLLVSGGYTPEWITEIEFSPNGQRILFLTDVNGSLSGEIYVINTDGTGLDSLTGGIACADGGASWSPDGDWIVFTSNINGNKNIYKVRTDGSRTFVQLTDDPANDFNPDW